MNVQIKIDSSCKEPELIIRTDKMTEEIQSIVKKIGETNPSVISGFQGDSVEVLQHAEIIRAYANDGKVFAETSQGKYQIRLRLYELEERLESDTFVRISNSELINLRKVKNFDLSFAGTICVKMSNESITYVSRRYVSKIKKMLGI